MYNIVTLEEVHHKLQPDKIVAFDTETDGFYGTIELAQFYCEGWEVPLLVRKPDPYYLANILKDQHFVAHLAHYDITTIQQQTGTAWIPNHFDCTFFASRLFYYKEAKFSLDDVIQYTLGYDPYKQLNIDKKELQKSNWTGELTEAQFTYAAMDVFHLLDVYNATIEAHEEFNYKLDILFTINCFDFQWNGLPVIESELQKRFAENKQAIEDMAMPINVNSYQQVRPYIGSDDSDALGLTRLKIQGNERAANVLKTRRIIKENSFLSKFDTNSGRIYGKFVPTTRSGRCASKDQNLEQLPRNTKVVFGVEEDSGRCLLYSDYATLELRGACAVIGETRMEQLLRNGKDLHGHTTSRIIKEDYNDRDRFVGKTCNFNLLYYGSATMLGSILIKDAEILLPDQELTKLRNNWRKLWPTIAAWQEKGVSAWRHNQVWATPLGRKYVGKLMTDQLNIQIQGFGAEVAKLATHYMSKEFGGLTHPEFMLCNFIHDSWIYEADNDKELCKYIADTIAKAMKLAWTECCQATKIKDLPMPVEVFRGFNWGLIEKEYIEKYEYT